MSWSIDELSTIPQQYNCQLLFHKATEEQIKNPELPTDVFIVKFQSNNETFIDLCRSSKMTNVFDLYYDKFGSGLKQIEMGYGRKNPKVWGYNPPEKKKRRK